MAVKIGDGYLLIEGVPNKSQIRRAAKEAGDRSGKDFNDSFKESIDKNSKTLKNVFSSVIGGLLQGAVGVAVIGIAAKIGVLITHMLGVLPALSSIISLSSLLPTAFIATISAIGILAVAFSGVGDAIKSAFTETDITKFNETLKNLAPSAQSFVVAIRDAVPSLKEFQKSIQEAFFKQNITAEFIKLRNVIPQILPNLTEIASSFGGLTALIISFTTQVQSVEAIKGVFTSLNLIILSFANNFNQFAGGFRDVIITTLPLFTRLGVEFGNLVGKFGAWMTEISASGQLLTWLNTAIATLKSLGSILLNIGSIIMSVLLAAQNVGGGGFAGLDALTKSLATFLKSTEGMSALTSFFTSLSAIASALTPVITTLAGALLTTLGPAITTIATALGPYLLSAVQALIPAFTPLANAFTTLIIALGPALPAIAALAGQLGGILAQGIMILVPVLNSIMGPLLQLGGSLLTTIGTLFISLLTALAPVITTLITGLAPVLGIIIASWNQLLVAIQPLLPIITSVLISAIQSLLPILIQFGLQIFSVLVPAFIQLVPYAMQLWVALLPLIPLFAQLLIAIMPLALLIIQLAADILVQLVPAIVPLIISITKIATIVLSILIPAISNWISWIITIVNILAAIFIPMIKMTINVFAAVAAAIAWVIEKLFSAGSAISSFVSSALSKIGGMKNSIVGFFSSAGDWLMNAGKRIIEGLISGVKSQIGRLKGVFSSITDMIPSWKGPLSTDLKLLQPSGEALMTGLMRGIGLQTESLFGQLREITSGIGSLNNSPGASSGIQISDSGQSVAINVGGITVNVSGDATKNPQILGENIADGLAERLADVVMRRVNVQTLAGLVNEGNRQRNMIYTQRSIA